MKSLKTITFVVAAATLLVANTASAERPANIANTFWVLQTNLDPVQLVITTQGGPGAPGAATCRHIKGDIGNVAFTSCTGISAAAMRCGSSPETCPRLSPGSPCPWPAR
jgi:hypothetical protein